MADPESDTEVSGAKMNAHWHTERRDKLASDGLRALLLLNGGGAVALLAFLQAIWKEPTASEIVPWLLVGMAFLVVGAALSGYTHFLRIETSVAFQMKNQDGHAAARKDKCTTQLAFIFFLAGIAVTIVGAFCNRP